MTLSVLDKSNYFKAILILARKDRKISKAEREMMLKIGTMLGFEREFCKNAIDEILINKYITPDPPKFSNPKIAESLIIDGLKLALTDRELVKDEIDYLKSIAKKNGLDSHWLNEIVNSEVKKNGKSKEESLNIEKYL
jgi:hypothetical protein